MTVRLASEASACPDCGASSKRVHSRYRRQLADLPIAGRPVRLELLVRRFFCDEILCGRRIFNERFDADVLAPWARRTGRLAVERFDGRPIAESDELELLVEAGFLAGPRRAVLRP